MYIFKIIFLKDENDRYKIQRNCYLCKTRKGLTCHRYMWDFKVSIPIYKLGGNYRNVYFIIISILYI